MNYECIKRKKNKPDASIWTEEWVVVCFMAYRARLFQAVVK